MLFRDYAPLKSGTQPKIAAPISGSRPGPIARREALESLLALYEPEATFVVQPGEAVTGTEALREAFGGFLALKPTFEVEVKKSFRAGDIALAFSDWTLTGTGPDGETVSMSGQGSDVLREQDDGSWLFVIDNPYGRVGAVSPGDI